MGSFRAEAGGGGCPAAAARAASSSALRRLIGPMVWKATVAICASISRRWVQPMTPPTLSFTARLKPKPMETPASAAKFGAAAGQTP